MFGLKLRNRSALRTTDTEENAMAKAAIIGESNQPEKGNKTPAAKGIATILYINAQKRFVFILITTLFDKAKA
jgi:hypothetical protein